MSERARDVSEKDTYLHAYMHAIYIRMHVHARVYFNYFTTRTLQ